MKLKLVVTSMSVLGLISASAFADVQANRFHQFRNQHRPIHQVAAAHDYKAMGGLVAQPAPVVIAETHRYSNNAYAQNIQDEMNQNAGRGKALPDWFNRVTVSGGANLDGHWGNLGNSFQGENTQRTSINDVYLNIGAHANDWTKAFASFSFNTIKDTGALNSYNSAYDGTANQLTVEQAYVTLGNNANSPAFIQLGKFYQDFNRYTIHPLTRSVTQVLSESLQTAAKIGVISPEGGYASAYVFDDNLIQNNKKNSRNVYGVSLGYGQPSSELGWDAGVSYISNLTGVNNIADSLANSGHYTHIVGGVALHGDVNSGPFNFGAHFVSAINRFNPTDLAKGSNANQGAKPWGADITAGYGFNAGNKNQNVFVSYQKTRDAVNIGLPKDRWVVGYDFDLWKSTNLGVEVAHSTDYNQSNGGTGKDYNTIGARASVRFG